jgi:hypothetical protein|tara:strand:+ start:5479 stop:5679 length:201 start_codon:yes stop_codon:yes gene_type:complete
MTEEQKEPTTKDACLALFSKMNEFDVKCVNIVYIPETGELILNHTTGMPRHEIIGLMEAVRDETKK